MTKRIVSMRLGEGVLTDLDELSKRLGQTRSQTIEWAIKLAIEASAGDAEMHYDLARQKRYGRRPRSGEAARSDG
jgi:metal-responsive CopG/Arc/MetJ family transcriptional regulator